MQGDIEPELTRREREVLLLLARGYPNKLVASTLGVSIRTAEVYRYSIMHKLKFHSISDLMMYAVRNNIVTP